MSRRSSEARRRIPSNDFVTKRAAARGAKEGSMVGSTVKETAETPLCGRSLGHARTMNPPRFTKRAAARQRDRLQGRDPALSEA